MMMEKITPEEYNVRSLMERMDDVTERIGKVEKTIEAMGGHLNRLNEDHTKVDDFFQRLSTMESVLGRLVACVPDQPLNTVKVRYEDNVEDFSAGGGMHGYTPADYGKPMIPVDRD